MSSEKVNKTNKPSLATEIVFLSFDLEGIIPGHDDLMIISVVMVNGEVKRVFVDQVSSANIIF